MTLGTRLLIFGATVLTVTAIALLSTRGQGPGPAAQDDYCRQPCELYRMVWVGDVLLADAAQRYLNQYGYTWPFEYVAPLLDGDFVAGNAEGPITTIRESYFANAEFDYNALPPAAPALAEVGFDALSLSNNHALDRGPEGLRDTLQHLRAAGLHPFGAGLDADEAAAPLLVQTPYGTVAILGFGEVWRQGAVAGPGQAGTVPFTDENIARARASALAAGAKWMVAFVHWGENYTGVNARQRTVAASFARAGYDLVIGAHPHVAQEVDIVAGMPVVYSLGNFTFGSSGRYTDRFPGFGLVARTYLGRDGFRALELTCIVTDNRIVNYQTRPCNEEQTRTLMRRLGPHVTLRGSKGIVELRRG